MFCSISESVQRKGTPMDRLSNSHVLLQVEIKQKNEKLETTVRCENRRFLRAGRDRGLIN